MLQAWKLMNSNGMASAFPLEQWLRVFWQIKNDTLTGSFGFVGSKNGFTIGKTLKLKAIFRTYKSNANTTDLCVKLLKTVTVNVLENKYNRKYSYGKVNVL